MKLGHVIIYPSTNLIYNMLALCMYSRTDIMEAYNFFTQDDPWKDMQVLMILDAMQHNEGSISSRCLRHVCN